MIENTLYNIKSKLFFFKNAKQVLFSTEALSVSNKITMTAPTASKISRQIIVVLMFNQMQNMFVKKQSTKNELFFLIS